NAPDKQGYRPLLQAVLSRQPRMVELLLSKKEYGVNINSFTGCWGTPLQAAIYVRDIEIVSMLLKHPKINVNPIRSHFALSLLHGAIKQNNLDIFTLLLSHPRVDVNLVSGFIMVTPLTFALSGQNAKFVQLLLQHPRLNVNASMQDTCWNTRVNEVANRKDITMLWILLQDGRI
ncbi:ankyrin repeat-containing domain protein, partial [Tuber indicum]